jgi:uncharacterized protein (TIGR02444 family)
MSNPFWEFSLATYRSGDVAAACLLLQDSFGVDVNFLLYGAWLAHHNQRLDDQHLRELEGLVSQWREQVVRPLRALRRQLAGYTEAAAVHAELKLLELRAEQQQQEIMYTFHQRSIGLSGADQPLLDNLAQVAQLASPDDEGWTGDIRHLASLIPL